MTRRSHSLIIVLLALCVLVTSVEAASFQVPPLRGPVTDEAGFLSPAAERHIAGALMAIKQQGGGTEIAVLTVKDLGGLTIEQASIQVVDEWKLGSEEKDNGVLLMFAKKERRARIEVGQGLEGNLTDAHSKRIIDETIIPLFRNGSFEQGILLGVYQVAQRTNPELNVEQIIGQQGAKWTKRQHRKRSSGFGAFIPILFILLFIFGGRGRGGRGGFISGLLPGLLLGSMLGGGRRYGGGGFSGGGFGGGGFGGGGGGFSGGGASGGW